jgi:glycerol-3-phosphate dehydrogenase
VRGKNGANPPGTLKTCPTKTVEISPVDRPTSEPLRPEPSAIVNATGAWVDHTLRALQVPSRQLIGGTKGSHFVTSHAGLREALAGRGIYAEAADGRPVFVLPLGDSSLVGTTDIPFSGDPASAVATEEELAYLLAAVNLVFPQLRLCRDDIDWHYSGVRPLPYVDASTPAAITRRHWLEENAACPVPLFSVIGGKLTTCRSLADEAADVLLRRLGLPRIANSRERPIPGGENYPSGEPAIQAEHDRLAARFHAARETISAVWRLYGTWTEPILDACGEIGQMLRGTMIPVALVRWMIEHEWAHGLEDLVCRRLMLDRSRLDVHTVEHLAELLGAPDGVTRRHEDEPVAAVVERLAARYGKRMAARSKSRHR